MSGPAKLRLIAALLPALLLTAPAGGQWTNRYPKVTGVRHHVYLEGYNLPTLAAGPTDPAPSPDGRTVAIAARGWLWLMDPDTREARRLTRGAGVDSRPAWSPDGRQIAFVRDDSRDTSIVLIDVGTGRERVLVDSPGLDLDPAFAPDGRSLFYSSAEAGGLDIWRVDLANGARTRITTADQPELQPQPLANGRELLIVDKTGSAEGLVLLNLGDGSRTTLRQEGIAPHLRTSAAATGRSYAATVPDGEGWQLLLADAGGGPTISLAPSARYPLTPSWSRNGDHVYFVEAGEDERFRLYRVAAAGGAPEEMSPVSWQWGEATARLSIRTRSGDAGANVAARLSVTGAGGHPLVPADGMARFDGQNGMVYFYSPGIVTLEVPAGSVRIQASHGFDGAASLSRTVRPGETVTVDLDIPSAGFDGARRGWYSADLHTHLNYGGPYQLSPEDLVLDMRGEGLDVATPQLANLHTRLMDQAWWGWRRTEPPLIGFAQEVRSHFLGHVAVIGADALYSPWFSGPGYPVYSALDRPNADALRFARVHGGLNAYVHPVGDRDPFPADGAPTGLPLELVPDALLGDIDLIDIVCLWSDELGSSAAWYRLLNLGLPIMPSAGSDAMHNFHRTMAIGSTRVYAKPEGALSLTSFLDAVRHGRSFVSTGPQLDFRVGGAEPGGVVATGPASVEWQLDAWSPTPVEQVEILVNGEVVWRGDGLQAAGHRRYAGRIDVPAGGWIAARVHGGETRWPVQDSYPFAHTAPVWFGAVGSADPAAARRAAADLLRWMTVAEARLDTGYRDAPIPRLRDRFAQARRLLEARAAQ